MAKIISIICLFIPAVFANCSTRSAKQSFSTSVNEFAEDLVKKISQDTGNHFITSTLSPWTLLAYTALGAAGTSLQELESVLRLHSRKGCTQKYFEITKRIYTPNLATSLKGTSAIFVDKNLPVIYKFQCEVREAGVSDVQQVSAESYERVANTINEFVKSATNGTVARVIEAGDLEDVVMIIVDVLTFKSAWKTPFPMAETKESSFYDELNNEIGRVNLMTVTGFFSAWTADEINATVVELPYGDNKLSMYLFVPYAGVKLSDVIPTIRLNSIIARLKKEEPQEATVSLPRFKMSSNINNLKEMLMEMGLRTIFDGSQAFFPKISHRPLYVSNLVQKAVVEVNEEGTSASAATEADFTLKSFSLTVCANKPFFYAIADKQTAIPVFAGAYSKPSAH